MEEYVVKPGDTLAAIAHRYLGSAGKWSVLAEVNDLGNPDKLRIGQRLKIPSTVPVTVPRVRDPATPRSTAATERVAFSEEGKKVIATLPGGDRIVLGTRYRKGVSRRGQQQPEEYINGTPDVLRDLALSQSEINVMLGTAENEGNLDAVNTYDTAFHSFGMFQWSSGTGGRAGELPALLQRIKTQYPASYDNYWGQFGLDVVDVGSTTGRFAFQGVTLKTAASKEMLRDYAWVLRFARAGEDVNVQSIQILHAIARLDRFYFVRQPGLGGRSLSEIITSEYGVALLLDNHVNRPGYVVGCVKHALVDVGIGPDDAATADDEAERAILSSYLTIRESYGTTPMTNAKDRAAVSRRYVDNERLSEVRGSFRSNRTVRVQP